MEPNVLTASPSASADDATDIDPELAAFAVGAFRRGDVDTLERLSRRGLGTRQRDVAPPPSAAATPKPDLLSQREQSPKVPVPPSAPVSTQPPKAEQESPRRLSLRPEFLKRGAEALHLLSSSSPDADADERLLHRLVADEMVVLAALDDARHQLAARLPLLVDDPRLLIAVGKSLREIIAMTNAIGRRVESVLATASTLRASRRMFSTHRGGIS
jgi:hypothetical protein